MSVLVRRTVGERRAYLQGAISAYAYVAARDETPAMLRVQLRAMIDLSEQHKNEPLSDDEKALEWDRRDRDFLAAAADKHEAERDAALARVAVLESALREAIGELEYEGADLAVHQARAALEGK